MANRLLTAGEIQSLFACAMVGKAFIVSEIDNGIVHLLCLDCGLSTDFNTQDRILSDADFIRNRVLPFQKRVEANQRVSEPKTINMAPMDKTEDWDFVQSKTIVSPPGMSAVKHDADKDPWHLAPWDAFRAIVKVMAFGSKKYAPRNWEKGFNYSRLYRPSIEHLNSWWMGEDKDPETGYSHLWHAACCVCFLVAHELRGIGTDDRPPKQERKDA